MTTLTTAPAGASPTAGGATPAPAGRTPSASLAAFARQSWAGLRVLLALTLLLGVVYPLAVTGVAKVVFPWQAAGSLLTADGARTTQRGDAVGSALVGQSFTTEEGGAADGWFVGRPSAAGDGYDTLASAGSNLGPLNPDLVQTIEERQAQVAKDEGVAATAGAIPADAVTASGSGLDPDVSPAYARLQVDRVARQRGLDRAAVERLVDTHVAGRALGVLGEPRVNVLRLNLALAALAGADQGAKSS